MIRRVLITTVISCALCMPGWAQTRPTAPVTLAIDTTSHGYAIPLDFSGLSFETGSERLNNAGTSGYFFSSGNTQLVTLFQNLGIKNLRVGGGSVDTEAAPDDTSIDNLFAFAKVAGVKIIYSVRMLNTKNSLPTLKSDDAAIAQYVWNNYSDSLEGFAIGNEPDWHNPYHTAGDPAIYETTPGVPGTAYPSYLTDWQNFAATIRASVPSALFVGPDTGAYTTLTYTPNATTGVSWTQQFAEDEKNSGLIADITQHFYVGGSPGKDTAQQAIDDMLSSDWASGTQISTGPEGPSAYTPYPWLYTNNLAPVLQTGLPYRLTESNDFVGGVSGASNSFASALWILDYMHWWAAHNAAGVNFHNKQWILTDTIVPDPNPCSGTCGNYQTAPKGYGIKAFDLGGHGYIEPATVANPDNVNVTAYAVGSAQDLYVTIVNKTHTTSNDATDAQITIQPNGFRSASAASMVLTDGTPGDPSLIAATLGGAAITNNSRWFGLWTPLTADTNGNVTVTVPAATAAVVKIHAASNYVGPVQIDQNGALEIFGFDSSGNIWHNSQNPSDLPNSAINGWSGWSEIQGVTSESGAAVARNLDNRLEIFIPTASGVYHNWQVTPGGAWNGWDSLAGNGITNLVAASNAGGGLSIFGIGSNGDIWYGSEVAPGIGWSGWSDLSGATIQPGFVVGQNLDGRLEVFGVDNASNVWHNYQTATGNWSGWIALPGAQLGPQLAVARNLDGRLEIFGADQEGNLWHNWQTQPGGDWNGWNGSDLSGFQIHRGFVVGQNADGRLEIFGVSHNIDVWHIAEDTTGHWTDWSNLGNLGPNPQLIVSNTADGRLQLFGIGANRDVWSDWQTSNGGPWSGWTDFGENGLSFYSPHP